jgi:DNA repair exonuclease SbcCD ATPase subunit
MAINEIHAMKVSRSTALALGLLMSAVMTSAGRAQSIVIDGWMLGNDARQYSGYVRLNCRDSDFVGLTVCQGSEPRPELGARANAARTIIHRSDNGRIVYVYLALDQLQLSTDRINEEVQEWTRRLNQQPRRTNPNHRSRQITFVAAWAWGPTLTPLSDEDRAIIQAGGSANRGYLLDLLGIRQSVEVGLPLYRFSGSRGYVLGARIDRNGTGLLSWRAVEPAEFERPVAELRERIAAMRQEIRRDIDRLREMERAGVGGVTAQIRRFESELLQVPVNTNRTRLEALRDQASNAVREAQVERERLEERDREQERRNAEARRRNRERLAQLESELRQLTPGSSPAALDPALREIEGLRPRVEAAREPLPDGVFERAEVLVADLLAQREAGEISRRLMDRIRQQRQRLEQGRGPAAQRPALAAAVGEAIVRLATASEGMGSIELRTLEELGERTLRQVAEADEFARVVGIAAARVEEIRRELVLVPNDRPSIASLREMLGRIEAASAQPDLAVLQAALRELNAAFDRARPDLVPNNP